MKNCLVVCKPNEGGRVVLGDKKQNHKKITNFIRDTSKFCEILDPLNKTMLKIEGKTNNFFTN